jgi:hypothetical protein
MLSSVSKKNKSVPHNEATKGVINSEYENAKIKLFRLIDQGMRDKKEYVVDKNFWRDLQIM